MDSPMVTRHTNERCILVEVNAARKQALTMMLTLDTWMWFEAMYHNIKLTTDQYMFAVCDPRLNS